MKYLKLFEDIDKVEVEKMTTANKFKNKLKEFCDNYLAYLIDQGFTVQTKYDGDRRGDFKCVIVLSKPKIGPVRLFRSKFTWDEIKDDFIPFFNMLSREYSILNTTFSAYPKNPSPGIDYSRRFGTTHPISNINELSITNKEILDDKVNDKLEKMELPKISWIKIKID